MMDRSVLIRAALAALGGMGLASAASTRPVSAQPGAPAPPPQSRRQGQTMKRFLVHVHIGPQDPTRAALAFLVAATALRQGHAVDLFLAGDGVSLLTQEALAGVEGRGTGRLGAHAEAIVAGGGRVYLSGLSARARGPRGELPPRRPAQVGPPGGAVRPAPPGGGGVAP